MSILSPIAPGPLPPRLIGRLAVRALHAELVLWPKPGLVSPQSPGSHEDMDAARMWRGIFSLRRAFTELALAGARGETFRQLQTRGQRAEVRLFAATGGVNTHRGALFHLGLLSAAAGAGARGAQLGQHVRVCYAGELTQDAETPALSAPATPGRRACANHRVPGARGEAAAGYPSVWNVALPELLAARARGADEAAARVQALFALIRSVGDTNLLHRGGAAGLRFAQAAAGGWLLAGGVFARDWRGHARAIHEQFVTRRLSPGGSADLLAAAIFVDVLGAANPGEAGKP